VTPTAWVLLGLAPLAIGLVVWGRLTGGPGPDHRHETVRQRPAQHSQKNRDEVTRRLYPPSAGWLPPRDRPGGEAPWPDEEPRERSQQL
jgi:hypothetical protein